MTGRSCLVFGASGQIGRFLLPRLSAIEANVYAVSRAPPAADEAVTWIRGNLLNAIDQIPDVDAILSVGPLDAFADWFERKAISGVTRVIAFSSMSAHSKAESNDPAERRVAARLSAAEAQVQHVASARGIGWTLFRPTMIYGAGTDRTLARIARFIDRWHLLPVPMAARGLRQPVHADDLAAACVAALDTATTIDKMYFLGGGERLPFDTMLRRLAMHSTPRALVLPIPHLALRLAARWKPNGVTAAAIDRLCIDLIADNSAASADFGYAPRAFDARSVRAGIGTTRDAE